MVQNEIIINDSRSELATIEIVGGIATKTVFTPRKWQHDYMSELIPRLIHQSLWYTARVYHFQSLPSSYRKYPFGYQYQMERLLPLTQQERDMIHVYTNMDDMVEEEEQRRFTIREEDYLVAELDNHPYLLQTLAAVSPYYRDLHDQQVMKTLQGVYKVVDLDSFAYWGTGVPHKRRFPR